MKRAVGLAIMSGALASLSFGAATASPDVDYDDATVSAASGELCEADQVFSAIRAIGWTQPPVDLAVRGIDIRVPYRPENNRDVGSWGETRTRTNGSAKFHAGVDLLGDVGEPTLAITAGRVVAVGNSPVLGNYVILRGNVPIPPARACNFDVLYAHLSSASVASGATVMQGQEVGKIGRTGNVSADTPSHLHLEVWVRTYLSGAANRRRYTRDPMCVWDWGLSGLNC